MMMVFPVIFASLGRVMFVFSLVLQLAGNRSSAAAGASSSTTQLKLPRVNNSPVYLHALWRKSQCVPWHLYWYTNYLLYVPTLHTFTATLDYEAATEECRDVAS